MVHPAVKAQGKSEAMSSVVYERRTTQQQYLGIRSKQQITAKPTRHAQCCNTAVPLHTALGSKAPQHTAACNYAAAQLRSVFPPQPLLAPDPAQHHRRCKCSSRTLHTATP